VKKPHIKNVNKTLLPFCGSSLAPSGGESHFQVGAHLGGALIYAPILNRCGKTLYHVIFMHIDVFQTKLTPFNRDMSFRVMTPNGYEEGDSIRCCT
jgi:hypothetical protein